MKKIYFLHGYQTTGKKFQCIEKFYKNLNGFLPVNWEWDEYIDISVFLEEKKKILREDTGEKILMADSMGANLAWRLVNEFSDLHYVMTNPVFSPEQIVEQERILPEMKTKIFSVTPENIKNKNARLIISQFDQTLDPNYYKKIWGDSVKVLKIPDEHKIVKMEEFMPSIHELILDAFEKSKTSR